MTGAAGASPPAMPHCNMLRRWQAGAGRRALAGGAGTRRWQAGAGARHCAVQQMVYM